MKNQASQNSNQSYANQQLLNIISPSGISFKDQHASMGEGEGKIFAVSRYPSAVDYGWLSELLNLPGTAATMGYRYSSADVMINAYNKRISELKSLAETQKNESDKQITEHAINDLKELINRISVRREPVGYFYTLLHIMDGTEELLNDRIRKVSGMVRTQECNLRFLRNKQEQALQVMSPWGIPNQEVSNIGERNMPMSTFVGGFPMAASGLNDAGGLLIGNSNGRAVLLNIWLRGKDRTNSNIYIQGPPGTGKSTLLKFLHELEKGVNNTRQVVWDAECEYLDLAKHPWMEGQIVDAASGISGRINPLQVRFTPRITEEDLEEGEDISEYMVYEPLLTYEGLTKEELEQVGFSDLALHIQNLRQFFSIYFGAENFKDFGVRKAFEKALIETYRRRNITWFTDISKLKNEEFPIVSEFYAVAMEFSKEESFSARERDNFERLSEMLYSLGEGADQFLWNGYTTLNPTSRYIVLNTSKLLEMDENIKNAQLYNLKMWEWHYLSSDRTEKGFSWMDEGYLFADPEYPQLIKLTRNTSKRGRKYEVGLGFITHSLVDILDPAVKRHTQAIIDNSCYKFLMGADGKNLEETTKLFKLTEKEVSILEEKARGKAVFFAGKARMELQIDVPDKLLEMMGTAGGR